MSLIATLKNRALGRRMIACAVTIMAAAFAGSPGHAADMHADAPPGGAVQAAFRPAIPPSGGTAFGVYDPHGSFAGDPDARISHIFVDWQVLDRARFRARIAEARRQGRGLMVTVQPYTKAPDWRAGGDHLFADILAGGFDREIDAICTDLGADPAPVLIRWGHEMEDATGRYPWARPDAEGYKRAYRYFVSRCRGEAPRAAFVWSPEGRRNLADYYPGDAYVDAVGLSLWGLQAADRAWYGGEHDFPQAFAGKYRRVAGFGKPVIIAELGVSGDAEYRARWFSSLFRTIQAGTMFPALRAVVYFNDKEPYHWPQGLGSPDWRIPPGWFQAARDGTGERRIAAR